MRRLIHYGLYAAAVFATLTVHAQQTQPSDPPSDPATDSRPTQLSAIQVNAAPPILGSGLDADKVPNTTYVLASRDLTRSGGSTIASALDSWSGSVNLNATIGNPNQPDLQFRGFTASPLQGTPEGLAVYLNGVRFNESFGDTVNWDLIPLFAIDSLNLTSANPVFGFNALGGAVAIQMKDGFTYKGVGAELSAGSFGRLNTHLEAGQQWGHWSAYAALGSMQDQGWRLDMPSNGAQFYGDLGYQNDNDELHLSLSAGRDDLVGTGPTPPALLALDPRTAPGLDYPGYMKNQAWTLSLRETHQFSDTLSLQGTAYVRAFHQYLLNGNVIDASACNDNPATFCTTGLDNALVPLYDQYGRRIPLSAGGEYPAELDSDDIHTHASGGSLMLVSNASLGDHGNHFVLGASIDHGITDLIGASEMASFNLDRDAIGSGLEINSNGAGAIGPVDLQTTNTFLGVYLSDTFDVSDRFSLTANARYNHAQILLDDQIGTSLSGDHYYHRVNPGLGATYKLATNLTGYVNYAENNRTPTAAELSCADPQRPCTLASFFIADPNLAQVVSRTVEGGLRGQDAWLGGRFTWSTSLFRTTNSNDIQEVASDIPGRGYFTNAGTTRRQGIEINTDYRGGRWHVFANYSLIDATYESDLALSSPNNPYADANGLIYVHPGDVLPGIPRNRLKLGADLTVTSKWTVGVSLQAMSNQVLFTDQSNQTPRLGGYAVSSLHTEYTFTPSLQAFLNIDNLFDKRYATVGMYTNASGVPFPQLPGGEIGITRDYGAAPPLAFLTGIRLKW
jgi:iron complex outermembrane recepter protein